MATVHITFGAVMGGGAPVLAPIPNAAQTIVSSGASQAATIIARAGDYATIATTGSIHVAFSGASPVAAANRGYLVPAGAAMNFGPLKEGDLVAVVDA